MASEIEICNLALSRIGQTQPIASFTEQSKAAEVCAQSYSFCRDIVLQDYLWPFATSWKVLALMGDPPTNWAYRYSYPSDCLDLRYLVIKGNRNPQADQYPVFELQFYQGQQTIITDTDQAEAVYTARVEDPTLFSPMFTNALAWRVAQEIAMPMAVDPSMMDNARQMYAGMVSEAAATALNEVKNDPNPESVFITGRR
jgi:hypothetical protein